MADPRRLFFLRHGLADREQYTGSDDDLRPLTEAGRRRIHFSAKFIRRLDTGIDAMVTSPLLRAAETAEIVADRLGLDAASRIVDPRLGHGFDLPALTRILGGPVRNHRRILFVGHEPGFSIVLGEITGGSQIVMKKGALARVDLAAGSRPRGKLVWLLQPRVLLGNDCD